MGSKSNYSAAQVNEILHAHKNTSIKLFNTATERLKRKVDSLTTKNVVLEKEMVELKSSVQFYSDTIDERAKTKVSQV